MSGNGSFKLGDCLVEQDLDRISRGSETVTVRPQVMEVLVYLASRGGQIVHADELLENLWPEKVVTSASIYNCITELRQALSVCDDGQTYIDTVSKKGYRIVVPVTGLDVSNELTPGRKLYFAIVTATVLALVYVAYDQFVLEPAQDSESAPKIVAAELQQSIAVLSFADMSPNKDQEYMSDGIAEELRNLLARVPELRVTARTTAFSFKGKDDTISEIGVKLNVSHVLEGAVRKAGNQIRITAQLIEASSDKHLWSETYTRELEDVFTIQDEIAAEVVSQLQITLLGELPTAKRIDAEAYTLFLQARYLGSQGSVLSRKQAASILRQVLQLEPGYAPALLGLSFYAGVDGEEWRGLAEQAFESDPTYAPALASLSVDEASMGNFVAAADWINRALALDADDPWVLWGVSNLLQALERPAVSVDEYMVSLDPVNTEIYSDLSFAYWIEGRYEEALETSATILRLSPEANSGHFAAAWSLLELDRLEEALAETEQIPSERSRLMLFSVIYHLQGKQKLSDAMLQEFIEKFPEDYKNRAGIYAKRGESDLAFEYLYKAAENPRFFPYRGQVLEIADDPRWAALMEKEGRSPERLAAIEFEYTPPAHAGQ